MGSQIPLGSIEAIFNEILQPYRCQCRLLKDASLVISVQDGDLQDTYLTVAGVRAEECRDERHIRLLARSILEELSAICEAPSAPTRRNISAPGRYPAGLSMNPQS